MTAYPDVAFYTGPETPRRSIQWDDGASAPTETRKRGPETRRRAAMLPRFVWREIPRVPV